jgi:hypothetical protein
MPTCSFVSVWRRGRHTRALVPFCTRHWFLSISHSRCRSQLEFRRDTTNEIQPKCSLDECDYPNQHIGTGPKRNQVSRIRIASTSDCLTASLSWTLESGRTLSHGNINFYRAYPDAIRLGIVYNPCRRSCL